MLYQENMPDLIYDHLSRSYNQAFTDDRNIGALSIMSRYNIYSKLLKTNYLINEYGTDLSNGEIVALLLLHYGSITSEQFKMLGICSSERALYVLSHRSNKGKGLFPIEAKGGDGVEKTYVLKPSGYNKIVDKLPRTYLRSNRIPAMMSRDRKICLHNTRMLDIVYATIADGMPPFYWHGYDDISFSKTIAENFAQETKGFKKADRQGEEYFTPDGIMEFRTGTLNYVFIEQDMSNESKDKITEKNLKYARFFDNNDEAAISTLMYNVSLNKRDQHAAESGKKTSDRVVDEFQLVKRYCEDAGGDIERAYLTIGSKLKAWESGSIKERMPKRIKEAYLGLEKSRQAAGKSWKEMKFSDYESYYKRQKEEELERSKEALKQEFLRRRMSILRQSLIGVLEDDEGMLRAVYNGLSLVVTNTRAYIEDRHYLLPMSKGLALDLQDTVYDRIANLENYGPHTYRYKPAGYFEGDGRYVLKNKSSAINAKGAAIADFYLEEISSDIGGNVRAAHFMNLCGKCERPTYLILLISSDSTATDLEKRVKFATKFGSSDPRRTNAKGLSVLFINYKEDPDRIFAIGRDHEKYYID